MMITKEESKTMTDIQASKDHILRVISAICTTGFTTKWQPNRRRFELRERFFFDSSVRMQKMTDDAEVFAMEVQTRRLDGGQASGTLPVPCDWSLGSIVSYIQELDEDEVADLPPAQMSLRPVQLMARILETIDDGQWHAAAGQTYRAITNADDNPEFQDIIIVMGCGDDEIAAKWSGDDFLRQGRS